MGTAQVQDVRKPIQVYGLLKFVWIPIACVAAAVAALVYWARLQGTPAYVAMHATEAMYGDGSFEGLPLQPNELEELGMTEAKALEVLAKIKKDFLPTVRIVDDPIYHKKPGKDAMAVTVEVCPGFSAPTSVEVIEEDGRGILSFSDLVASYRAAIYRSASGTLDKGATMRTMNEMRDLLIEAGSKGYWDISKNTLQPWPEYAPDGEWVASR